MAMHFLTKPVLRGKSVALRPLAVDDAEAMYAALKDPELRRLTGTHKTFTLAEVVRHCGRLEAAANRWDYGIVADQELIGEAVLNEFDEDNRSISLRIAIWHANQRDKGYGTEATSLLVGFAFRDLPVDRIELEVYRFNDRARQVYEKVGFTLEGVKREALIWNSEKVDALIMSLLRRDYVGGGAEPAPASS